MAGHDLRSSIVVASHFSLGRRARGFTIVELIAVMVVLGILAAIGVSRFMARKTLEVDTFTQSARAMLRYGQKIAVAQNRSVHVRINGENIALCFDAACTLPVATPAISNNVSAADTSAKNCLGLTGWYCTPVPSDISYTVAPAITLFYFDQKGKPYASTDAPTVEASTLAPVDITISGDGSARTITVERETGYVF